MSFAGRRKLSLVALAVAAASALLLGGGHEALRPHDAAAQAPGAENTGPPGSEPPDSEPRGSEDGAAGAETRNTEPAPPELGALYVDGVRVPGFNPDIFNPEVLEYDFGVAHNVTEVSVEGGVGADTTKSCGTDNDTSTPECEVTLGAEGSSTALVITVTRAGVSAEYTLTIHRGFSGAKQWKASRDIYVLEAATDRHNPTGTPYTNPIKHNGRGIWSDGTTLWAANVSVNLPYPRVFAFALATGEVVTGEEIDLFTGNPIVWHQRRPHGVAGTSDVIIVSNPDMAYGEPRVRGYVRNSSGDWVPSENYLFPDTGMQSNDTDMRGLWTDGEILWVGFNLESGSEIRAYRMPGGAPIADRTITMSGVDSPAGLWSDGETIWVAKQDQGSESLVAFDLYSGARVSAKDFARSDLEPSSIFDNETRGTLTNVGGLWGIWSDGGTMWVMGGTEDIFSYNMPVSTGTLLKPITVTGIAGVTEPLDSNTRTHTIGVGTDQASATLHLEPRHFQATMAVTPADANATLPGHQVDLTGGPVTVRVTVTAQDGSTTGTYEIEFGRPPAKPTNVRATDNTGLLIVNWNAPSNAAGITSYDLRYAPTDQANLENDASWTTVEEVWTSDGGGPLTHLITGLTNEQDYYLEVRAENDLGAGDWSDRATGTPHVSTSLDVKLTTLVLNGVALADFDPDDGTFTLGVASDVASESFTWTVRSGTEVFCSVDTDTTADGCQMTLTANSHNELRLTLVRGTSVGNYLITVNRGRDGTFRWKADRDFYGFAELSEDLNGLSGRGLWSDGDTLWAAHTSGTAGTARLYAFDLDTGARDANKDVALAGMGTSTVRGITGHDGRGWVNRATGSNSTSSIHGYTIDSRGRWSRTTSLDRQGLEGSDLQTLPSARRGITTDGEILWSVFDGDGVRNSDHIQAIGLLGESANERLRDEEFGNSLRDAGNEAPLGLWTDGETVWVADDDDEMLYAYDVESGARSTAKEFSSDDIAIGGRSYSPWGIWSDGETMWIMDTNEYIYGYEMPVSTNTRLKYLRAEGEDLAGFDPSRTSQSLALPNDKTTYTITTRTLNLFAGYEFTSDDAELFVEGHQVDVTNTATLTIEVTAQDGSTTATYSIELGRAPALMTGATVTPADRSLVVTWAAPSDTGTSAVTGYELRYTDEDSRGAMDDDNWTVVRNLPATPLSHTITGLSPRGTYYVQVRAVNAVGAGPWIPHDRLGESGTGTPGTSGSDVSTLASLTVSPGALTPAFSATVTSYRVTIETGAATAGFTATATDPNAEVVYIAGDAVLRDADTSTPNVFDVTAPGAGESRDFSIRVTAENEVARTWYRITLAKEAASNNANLASFSLGRADLDALLNFSPARTSYSVDLPFDATEITLTAETENQKATVQYWKGNQRLPDNSGTTPGHQVLIDEEITFQARVTAGDGQTTKNYTFTLRRVRPVVSVAPAGAGPFSEGDTVPFAISVPTALGADLVVEYQPDGSIFGRTPAGGERHHPAGRSVRHGEHRNRVRPGVRRTERPHRRDPDPHRPSLRRPRHQRRGHGGGARPRLPGHTRSMADHRRSGRGRHGGNRYPAHRVARASEPVRPFTRGPGLHGETSGPPRMRRPVPTTRPWTRRSPSPAPSSPKFTTGFRGPQHWDPRPDHPHSLGRRRRRGRTLLCQAVQGSPDDDFYDFFYEQEGVEVEIAASTAASHDTGLAALSAAPATLAPAFATATKAYTGTVAHTVGQVTVSATPSDSNAHAIGYYDANDAEITDASDTVAGMQVALVVRRQRDQGARHGGGPLDDG